MVGPGFSLTGHDESWRKAGPAVSDDLDGGYSLECLSPGCLGLGLASRLIGLRARFDRVAKTAYLEAAYSTRLLELEVMETDNGLELVPGQGVKCPFLRFCRPRFGVRKVDDASFMVRLMVNPAGIVDFTRAWFLLVKSAEKRFNKG